MSNDTILNMQSPRYEYSRSNIQEQIQYLKNLFAPFGLTVRYAIKANPYPKIISMMHEGDIHFDASSSYEAFDLIKQGISGDKISLSSQQSAHNIEELLSEGVLYVATSIKQLELFLEAKNRPGNVGVRINPDMGHGHNKRTSTGGVNASFGIWHEYAKDLLRLTKESDVLINRLHIHIGSGADPEVWGSVMDRALKIVEQFTDVVSLDIGGGFKVCRYDGEKEADMVAIMSIFDKKLSLFAERTGRKLRLEIEPGTYLIAHAGTLVAHVDDIVDTGANGYTFLRLNTGMNDFLRSSLYGALHKIDVINDETETEQYVVVGHNCESGDIFTPIDGNPEEIQPRTLKRANIGDEVHIYDTGAYCASMCAKGYNSFPNAQEVMVN